MDIQKEREAFEWWFKQAFNYQEEYLDNTIWDGAGYKSKDEYHPDYCNASNALNISFKAWQAAKAQAVSEGFVVFPKKQTSKMRSLARDFDARLSLTKYEQLHNIWVKQAMIEAQEQK